MFNQELYNKYKQQKNLIYGITDLGLTFKLKQWCVDLETQT